MHPGRQNHDSRLTCIFATWKCRMFLYGAGDRSSQLACLAGMSSWLAPPPTSLILVPRKQIVIEGLLALPLCLRTWQEEYRF